MSTSDPLESSRRPTLRPARRRAIVLLGVALLGVGGIVAYRLHTSVYQAMGGEVREVRPLSFVVVTATSALPRWGSSDVVAVLETERGRLIAGGDGVRTEKDGHSTVAALPTLRVAAAVSWRGNPLVALSAGGLFRLSAGQWEEMRSGWGSLHARTLVETEGGEILVGAREGLFRVAWGAQSMERLSRKPIRSVAVGPGLVLAGGEEGLLRVTPGREEPVLLPDAWVESVVLVGETVLVATPSGLLRQTISGFDPVPGGELGAGVEVGGAFWAPSVPPDETVVRVEASGALTRETLPAVVRRTLMSGGALLADTDLGLYLRDAEGWQRIRDRRALLPDGQSHVGALARYAGRLHVGLFDGGLLSGTPADDGWSFAAVQGTSAWGINALLATGGELRVASLRGAARYDGRTLREIAGPGAAFSLAETSDGVATGYAQGVSLPGSGLLSAFHGLPGNQALALAGGSELLVGTPTGLGAIVGRRVLWRVTAGEGHLPHPWVTSLARLGTSVFVGTFGGGVARRSPGLGGGGAPLADSGIWQTFPETAGLKINTGCLAAAGGRIFAGTDGHGLWALGTAEDRFERLELALPSPRVTALLVDGDVLWIGTDEGLSRMPLPAAVAAD